MSQRTSSVLVGAFVIGALVIAIAGALFFAGGGFGVERRPVVMVFDGSLHGLNVGAPVALRGVTIGQVTGIDLVLNAREGDLTMVVEAQIESGRVSIIGGVDEVLTGELVARGLRAQLGMQSLLTGLLYVQLDFHPNSEPRLAAIDSPYAQIPTIPTELEQLRSSFDSIDYAAIATDVERIASGLDTLLNNPDMQAMPGSLRATLSSVEAASAELGSTLASNSHRLAALLEQGDASLERLDAQLQPIGTRITSTLDRLDSTLAAAEKSLQRVEQASAPDSPSRRQLGATLQELTLAARALRNLASSLEANPQALLRGRPLEATE
jgi:paraquat-inducible protein B